MGYQNTFMAALEKEKQKNAGGGKPSANNNSRGSFYSTYTEKTQKKKDEKKQQATASDIKKEKQSKEKQKEKTKSPEIKAFGAGDYGAGSDTRVDKVLRGAAESTAASYINTAATLAGGTGELTMGQSAQAAVKGESQQKAEQQKKAEQDKTKKKLYDKADELAEKSEKEIESAKEGLGKVGQTLVNAGVAGTQMLGDAALNMVAPGAGMVGMGLRSFGSGAQEQRQKGGSETDQFLGGLKSAGIEMLTEKIGGPFEKVYGKSFLGKAINNGVEKLSKSGAMADVLKYIAKGGTEAVEEVVSDILNPLADRLLDLDGKRGSGEAIGVFSKENVQQMVDDALVGGILGLVGVGGQVVGDNVARSQQRTAAQEIARDAAQEALAGRQQTTPPAEGNADTAQQAQLNSALQNEQPQEAVNPLAAALGNVQAQRQQSDPENHIDNRTMDSVGSKSVHAFQYEHPELHDFYVDAAQALKADVEDAVSTQVSKYGKGTTMQKSEAVEKLMDEGLSRQDILTAIDAIERNHGAEDYAKAKRVELVLDEMLSKGYMPSTEARGNRQRVAPNSDYLNAKAQIEGSAQTSEVDYRVDTVINDIIEAAAWDGETLSNEQAFATIAAYPEQYGLTTEDVEAYSANLRGEEFEIDNEFAPADDGLGAANKGFEENMDVATSRYRTNSMERNYDPELLSDNGFEIESGTFDYKVKHNADTLRTAQTMFDYYLEDGGIDAVKEAVFNENLPGAERGTLAEIAQQYLAQQEREALYNNEMTSEEYEKLVQDRREIAKEKQSLMTESAQTLQANSMWNRSDNPDTVFGEASDALAESGLDVAEQKARLKQLDGWLTKLQDINPESKEAMGEMKSLIKEIADKRGVTRLAVMNKKTAPIANKIIDWSLDRLDYNQLKQLTLNSAQQSVFDLTLEADVGQKIKAVQVMFMLSRPKTLNRNLTGNASFSAIDTLSMNGATLADMLMSQVTGTRSVAKDKGIFAKEARKGMGDAAVKAIAEIMLDANMGAENRYQMTSSRTFKADGGVLERIFSVLERENAMRMVMTDEAAKGATRERAKAEVQKLIDEGKIKDAGENYAQEYADYLAKERTFQQDSGIADVISQLRDALNTWIGTGDSGRTFGKKEHVVHSFGAGDIVAPFTKVAGNLVSTAYNYSTVKAVTGFADMCKVMHEAKTNGSVDPAQQAKAVKDFSRGVTGTTFTLICFALAKANLLRRADDEDDANVAALNAAEGMTGTQLNIDAILRLLKYGDNSWQDGDTLLDISSLEPLNTLMAVGTVSADWNEDSTMNNIFKVLDTFGESAEELPVLQFKANVDKDVQYGDKKSEAIVKEGLNTVISSIIPNIVSGVATGTDENYRDIYSNDSYGGNLVDNVKSRIVGARETLPVKKDPFGEDKTYSGSPLARFLNAMFNPVGVNTYGQSNLSQEFQDVRDATGSVNFYPDKTAPKKLTYKQTDYELSYDERQKYLEVAGEYYKRIGSEAISDSIYKNFSDEEKADFLKTVKSEAEKLAKASVLGEKGVDTNHEKKSAKELLNDTAYKFASGNEDIYIRVSTGDSTKGRITALQNGYPEDKVLDTWVNDEGKDPAAKTKYLEANEKLRSANKQEIPLEMYLEVQAMNSDDSMRSERDESGKEIKGKTHKDKMREYVNSLDASADIKQAIWSTLYKR